MPTARLAAAQASLKYDYAEFMNGPKSAAKKAAKKTVKKAAKKSARKRAKKAAKKKEPTFARIVD